MLVIVVNALRSILISRGDYKLSPKLFFYFTATPAEKSLALFEKSSESYKNYADSSFS